VKPLLESIFEMSQFIDIFQILLDIGLIGFIAFLFLKRPKNHQAIEDLARSMGKIVEETKEISVQFEANLHERQKIIQQLLLKLDQKVSEAQQVCQKLENLQRQAQCSPPPAFTVPSPRSIQSDSHEILRLAQRGLDAAAIAKRLQKPLGEVELILNLQRISPDR
jgi:hypothetical protein